MRHRSRPYAPLALIGAAIALCGGAVPPAGVHVTVTGLRSAHGLVQACLTADARRFPDCSADPLARKVTVPATGDPSITFGALPPGRYAIAVLHDENGNGRADFALAMIPREGFGFSRNAPVRMGPPEFEAAAFTVGEDRVEQAIRMRYLL